ncbi:MAG: ABC transporter permease, partial [Rhodoferax ferrireducens]
MFDLLKTFSWQELIQHPWRNAAAVVAVMLGVALAFSVQLINASALDEFSQAVRSVSGQPDLELRSVRGSFDEAVFARVARHPQVRLASPVLELGSYTQAPDGQRAAVRVVGIDALVVPFVAPDLMPRPLADADRLALFAPDTVFLNPAAQKNAQGSVLRLQSGLQMHAVTVAGSVRAGGAALAVMDIGAAQELFGKQGQLTRIDL